MVFGVIIATILGYFGIESLGTYTVGNYSVAQVEYQRVMENKSILSVTSNGEQFLIPLHFKDIEKEYFEFEKGEKIVFQQYNTLDRKPEYHFVGRYFIPYIASSFIFFLGILWIFFGWQVLRPFFTLLLSFSFVTMMLFPSLMSGENFLLVGLGGITCILFFSILFTHGFSRASYIAAFCSVAVLIFSYVLGEVLISLLHLFGYAGSNISYLELDYPKIDIQGIFLIGIYLGVVGVIDDITMAQTTAAKEIQEANPEYSQSRLYTAGMHLGKAHVFSMINTLLFAYIGTSIPVYFYIMTLEYPFWVIMNTTLFAEEFIRIIIAFFTILAAIPLTAFVSAWWFTRKPNVEH